jgi:D-alanine-D-alanine ligase
MTRLTDPTKPTAAPPNYPKPRDVQRKLRITVLAGGPSAERDVSLKSGQAIASALESAGHSVQLADISPDSLDALDIPSDMVFIALHGTFGEDGQIQRILEQRGITYCGCDARASALAMDKAAAKCRFVEADIPTPRFEVITPQRVDKILVGWRVPVVIKPTNEGSSVGCHIVQEAEQLEPTLRWLMSEHERCLIEQYIKGWELTVGILGETALPPIQIRTRRKFYDYQAKYIDNDTEYLFDIDLPAALLEEIQALSVKAHQALDCREFSRVDWMVDETTLRPYVLEINTIPGFTDHSLLPKAAQHIGFSFADLCQQIVDLTMMREK